MQDAKNKNIENIMIISGDHLCRMDYMKLVEVQLNFSAKITSCIIYIVHEDCAYRNI